MHQKIPNSLLSIYLQESEDSDLQCKHKEVNAYFLLNGTNILVAHIMRIMEMSPLET